MVREEGRRRAFGRGMPVAAAAAIILLAALVIPGCGSGAKDEASSFAALFDAKTACVLLEWVPAARDGAGKGGDDPAEPCQRAVEQVLGLLQQGKATRAGGEEETAPDPEAAARLREAIGRVAGLLVGGKLFAGPLRYGAMIAPPEGGEMVLPSAADLLVATPTEEGERAIAALLDALAARFPDRVRPAEGAEPREWTVAFPSFHGEALVRLGKGELRAAFGGGSLAGERDRLVRGEPAATPLGDVLPGEPVSPETGGARWWLRPAAAAEPVAEAVRRGLAGAEPPGKDAPPQAAMVFEALRGAAPGAVRELLASFAEITLRGDAFRGASEARLAGQVAPLVKLFHEREGSLSAASLAGLPEDTFQATAFLLPPLDDLARAFAQTISPETAPLFDGQLDTPLPVAPAVTVRRLLKAIGPEVVFWRQAGEVKVGDQEIPSFRNGLAVQVRDREAMETLLGTVGAMAGGLRPETDGDAQVWDLSGHVPSTVTLGPVLALGPDRLVVAPSREVALAVLRREGGVGEDPAVAGAVERLAGGRPVGFIGYQDVGAGLEVIDRLQQTIGDSPGGAQLPLELRGLLGDLLSCSRGMASGIAEEARTVQVGTRTPDGFRARFETLREGGP